MINRYEGEIHINPIRILRGDDFNNDGHIKDINATLSQALELNHKIGKRLQAIKTWLDAKHFSGVQFRFWRFLNMILVHLVAFDLAYKD